MKLSLRAQCIAFVSACGIAFATACSTVYSNNDAGDDGDAADARGSGLDGSVANPDSGAGEDSGNVVQGGWAVTPPSDFPAHFAGISPPATLDDLTGLCGIDTGSASSAPSYSICANASATPVVVTSSPNLVVVDSQNALVLWTPTLTTSFDIVVKGTRALAIISTDALTLDTTIDVSAIGITPGPGASDLGKGASGSAPFASYVGGGGGAFGTAGANGGAFQVSAVAGSGGAPYGADAAAFSGGSQGGASSAPSVGSVAPCGYGGAGGGAIQISAAGSLIIFPGGKVLANGGGGGGACNGDSMAADESSGGGGGSGGTIYLESGATFEIQGTLIANGGGGGGSVLGADYGPGVNGANGTATVTPASGGSGTAPGGSGGAGTTDPAAGITTTNNGISLGGGGGGAVGRIWFRMAHAPGGAFTSSPGAVVLSF